MKNLLRWYPLTLVLVLCFFIWFRRPAGRGTSDPDDSSEIGGLEDFDNLNPDASDNIRRKFFDGVQAHLRGDFLKALDNYENVLDEVDDESTTLNNLREIGRRFNSSIDIDDTDSNSLSRTIRKMRDWFLD